MSHGLPIVRTHNSVNVRRFIAQHIQGLDVSKKVATAKCNNPACCAPDHIDLITRKMLQRKTAVRTQHQQRHSRRAKLSAHARLRSPLNDAVVASMRASDKSGRELAAEHGVALATVQHILAWRSWKDYSSPFAGLMA